MFNQQNMGGFFKTQGIGLGLSTSKILTKAMQGGIHMITEEGKGTQVGFSIMALREQTKVKSQQLKTEI